MGFWSIELPSSHPLASIDQTGKVTFQPHTEMTSYTIKFTGTTAETKCEQTEIRGNIVVYPCTGSSSCTCNVTPSGTKVPSTASSTKVIVGAVNITGSCTNLSWSFSSYEGENFLTGLEVRDGYVYAAVSQDNPSSESRFVKYSATPSGTGVISGPSHFAVEQEGKGAPPVSECPNIGSARLKVLEPNGSTTSTLIVQLTGADNTITSCTISSTASWIQNLTIVGRASGVFDIMGTYTANTGSSIRYGDIKISKGSSNCDTFGVSQFPNNW